MGQEPLPELRDIRRHIEHACEDRGPTYADYLSQAPGKYTERLVRRGPKPRLKVKERRMVHEASGEV
jgi:hypothetical protein